MSPTQCTVEEEETREGVGVPLLLVPGIGSPDEVLQTIKSNSVNKLPTPEEVSRNAVDIIVPSCTCIVALVVNGVATPFPFQILEGLGLGPSGPPIPEPTVYQVYPYPLRRKPVQTTRMQHFTFVLPEPTTDQLVK